MVICVGFFSAMTVCGGMISCILAFLGSVAFLGSIDCVNLFRLISGVLGESIRSLYESCQYQ